jgi:tetrahydromethanopterin S-methyltransferase subunit F
VLYVTALLPLATSGRAVIAVGVVSAIVLLVIVLRTES